MDFYSKELIDYIMVLCERIGPKTYKHDDKRLMQMKSHMIETDPVNVERKFNLALAEVINPDNKALSKMDLIYMKKNKKMKSKTLMYMNT